MNADTLLENFEIFAEAPGGIDRLRELLLHLGVSGKLLPQISAEVREEILWSVDSLRLDEHRLWGESYLENPPATWPKVPLARLGSWGSGGTPTRGNKTYYDGEIPWLVIGDLNDGVVTRAANSITKKGLEESSAVIVPVGAVFVAMYGSIGKSGIAGIECATNQAIAHCVPDRKVISTEYLFLIIRAVKPRLFSQGRGLAQQNISQTVLKHLMISVPPLAEQNRIVAKVDELMALCDQLEQQQKQRDNLRTATRRSAIDAISTATTPEELETAWKRINNNWEVIADTPESIESIRGLILGLGTRIGFGVGIQKSPKRKLNEVSHVSWGNLSLTKTSYVEEGQFLAISAAGPDGRIGHAEHDKYTPVISAIGARCGTMFMPDEKFTAIKNTMTVTPDRKKIDNWYLFYALKGSQLPRRGTAQPFLSKTDIENFEITVPSSLEDQRVIVAKVDELMALCDQLESELKSRSDVGEKFARSVVNAA